MVTGDTVPFSLPFQKHTPVVVPPPKAKVKEEKKAKLTQKQEKESRQVSFSDKVARPPTPTATRSRLSSPIHCMATF